jgi:hypothetical protein
VSYRITQTFHALFNVLHLALDTVFIFEQILELQMLENSEDYLALFLG